ncbi:MAG: transposase [Ruminococcaceae bacterium]|nr:transposase [Oscillospiraceae bacterium]
MNYSTATSDNKIVAIENKYSITMEEATALTGIGINTIRHICDKDGVQHNFLLMVGKKRLIKRVYFLQYLDNLEFLSCS